MQKTPKIPKIAGTSSTSSISSTSSRYLCTFDDIMELLCSLKMETLASLCDFRNIIEKMFELLPYDQRFLFEGHPTKMGMKINKLIDATRRYKQAENNHRQMGELAKSRGQMWIDWRTDCQNTHVVELAASFHAYKPKKGATSTIENLLRDLNSVGLIHREDLIEGFISSALEKISEKDSNLGEELTHVLEVNHWNPLRKCFFRAPNLEKIVIDLNELLNTLSNAKFELCHKEWEASDKIFSNEALLSYKDTFNTGVLYLLYSSKSMNKSFWFQALVKCYVLWGLSTEFDYNKSIFDANIRFIKSSLCRKEEIPTIQSFAFKRIEKLRSDDPTIDIVRELVNNLSVDRMGSSLSPFISEYEDIISSFETNQLTTMVSFVLTAHGWNKGFQRSPNRELMVSELKTAISRCT